jgi:hypothetical protein
MKTKITVLVSMLISFAAHAEHNFVFLGAQAGIQRFEYHSGENVYEDAFKEAALSCYRHFKAGRRLNETEGLKIIDICANPRKS